MDIGCESWGWNVIDGGTLHRIRERMSNFETMTFREILRSGSHEIDTWKLCRSATKRMTEKLLQFDTLMSLRISARERLWGIRTGNIIDLLWWDPEHEICPSEPKHT